MCKSTTYIICMAAEVCVESGDMCDYGEECDFKCHVHSFRIDRTHFELVSD
jgi:hypothetical protein